MESNREILKRNFKRLMRNKNFNEFSFTHPKLTNVILDSMDEVKSSFVAFPRVKMMQTGIVYEIMKYTKSQIDGEESVWLNGLHGRYVIGQDCKFINK